MLGEPEDQALRAQPEPPLTAPASRGISRSSASARDASSPAKGPRDKATRVGYRPLSLDRSGSLLQRHKEALSDVSETDEDARGARNPTYGRATHVSRVQQR